MTLVWSLMVGYKPGEEGVRELNVLHNGELIVPLGHTRIGRSKDRGSCVESGYDPSLCNGEGLLLL